MFDMSESNITIPNPRDLASWSNRKLDNAIRRGHTVAGAHKASYEEAATYTGVYLLERKRRLGHGNWLPWLEENFEGDRTTAHRYMKAAEEWISNVAPTQHLDAPDETDETPEPPVAPVPPRTTIPEEPKKAREKIERGADPPKLSLVPSCPVGTVDVTADVDALLDLSERLNSVVEGCASTPVYNGDLGNVRRNLSLAINTIAQLKEVLQCAEVRMAQ